MGMTLAGCSPDPPTRTRETTQPSADAEPPRGVAELFRDWPAPKGALVISGQMLGYLEPCGCSEDQKGGLGRRYDLIEQLRKKDWPVAAVDLGSLINDPNGRAGLEQTKIKLDIALKALNAMNYSAFALSAADLRLGVLDALGQYLQQETPQAVAANVRPAGGLETALVPSARTTAGPVRIGVTAAIDPAALEALNDPTRADLLQIQPPGEALSAVLADLEGDTDVQVLLVQGPPEMARDLAGQFPGFDVVVATSPYAEPPETEPQPLNDGKTWLITVGKKGMHVGVLGIYPDAEPRFRYQDVSLTKAGFAMAPPMARLIDEDFPALLEAARVVENYPRREHPTGAEFVGAKACRQCHPRTYAKWEGSGHAHAFESIVQRGRAFDAECVSCHATGLDYASGFRSAELTANLKGNQCENCHGPGSKHIEAPTNSDIRQAMRVSREEAESLLCVRCHDEDNSPKFNFATYSSQIDHKGLDKYDD
jgi:hypothetical protein